MKNIIFLFSTLMFVLVGCGDQCEEITWYQDLNQNGIGNEEQRIISCIQPDGYVDTAGDLYDECEEDISIQPYWALCGNVDICNLETTPIIAMIGDEAIFPTADMSFTWTNSVTSEISNNHFIIADKGSLTTLEISLPDGCVYIINYEDDCN